MLFGGLRKLRSYQLRNIPVFSSGAKFFMRHPGMSLEQQDDLSQFYQNTTRYNQLFVL